jgi:hypothetical protein
MTEPRRTRIRRGARLAVALLLLVAMAGVFAAMVVELQSRTRSDADAVATQRSGVALTRPLIPLTVHLSGAQAAVAQGNAVDRAPLDAAVAAVADVDARQGAALGTSTRWSDLRAALPAAGAVGPAAVQPYADATALAMQLIDMVGDRSGLFGTGDTVTVRLAEAALERLPSVLAAAGNVVAYASDVTTAHVNEAAAARLDLAVARVMVATSAEALQRELQAAMESAPAPDVAKALDVLLAAVQRLAPPAPLRAVVADTLTTDAAARAAADIRAAATVLATACLDALDQHLAGRADDLAAQRARELGMATAGVFVCLVLLWWSAPQRERAAADGPATLATPDVAEVSVQVPAVDARDLLAIEELMHVGRGVRARPRDEADDAG